MLKMTKEQRDSATAAMAFAFAMNNLSNDHATMLRQVDAADAAARTAGIDPAKVGLN